MKTLANKNNPAIRMTAPEIEVHEEEDMYFIPVSDYCIPMYISDWTLVEEDDFSLLSEVEPDELEDMVTFHTQDFVDDEELGICLCREEFGEELTQIKVDDIKGLLRLFYEIGKTRGRYENADK